MSKIDDFLAKTEPKVPTYLEVEGLSACCQVCNVQVEEGRYFSGDKILMWICPDGHKSYMENVYL